MYYLTVLLELLDSRIPELPSHNIFSLYYIARDLVVAAVDIMMTGKEADTENGNVAPDIETAVEKDDDSQTQTHCISIIILINA